MRTITLQVNGRTRTFSEEELVAIVEEYEAIVALLGEHQATTQKKEKGAQTTDLQITDEQTTNVQTADEQKQEEIEVAKIPTEGKWFEVRPAEIDQRLFSEEKSDKRQEKTRQLILEAFAKMKNNSKYARTFKTLMPEKTWNENYVKELRKYACNLGDHMADWVEQALEWAQRIANGETWKAVCSDPDTANWFRMIEWKYGDIRLIGGSKKYYNVFPASNVCIGYFSYDVISDAVPLVVSYK